MKTSDSQKNLMAALFAARREFPHIPKTKKGQAGNRSFMYAPMEDILPAIEPILAQHSLMVTQPIEGHAIVTRLEHIKSGEWRESVTPMYAEHASEQSYGISLTYRKRYSFQSILGFVTEEDTDGQAGEKKRKGADAADPKNPNGTSQAGYTDNVKRQAFEGLQPAIQNALRQAAPHIDKAIPDVPKAIQVATMAIDSWPDEDQAELKKGLWYLLDSKTRTAIDRHQKGK